MIITFKKGGSCLRFDVRMLTLGLAMVSTLMVFVMPSIATAETSSIPANAYAVNSNYGDPWECNRGFNKEYDECIAVNVPENAFLRSSGDRWECERGYRKVAKTCLKVDLPAHSYLTKSSYSNGWMCERGYRDVAGACVLIEIPENAYLSDTTYSKDWVCDRGYKATEGKCLRVILPDNAHLDYSGNDWECTPPYQQSKQTCIIR